MYRVLSSVFLCLGLCTMPGCDRGAPAGPSQTPRDSEHAAALEMDALMLLLAVETELEAESEASVQADEVQADEEERNASEEQSNSQAEPIEARLPDVIYVPTPEVVVDEMLELAAVAEGDVVYDLGCGDGRIVITAAQRYGVKAWGFDIDPARVSEARANAKAAGVEDLVTIEQRDIFTLDLSPASVVTLYLLPALNVRLIPQLQKLKPGSRIVSHDFDMPGVPPLEHVKMRSASGAVRHDVYLWHTPLPSSPATTQTAPPEPVSPEAESEQDDAGCQGPQCEASGPDASRSDEP
jgi:SAM-dependent methyltransferase